ncbi:MAG TPA: hypothetical protein DCS82_13910 [Rhodospirillaceae bacterium]|nr:hypothetical protein [Rhodospirillaceae bacterium]HAT36806.1 hypothetical protein [Rhodospirillaceae bacterium]
MEDRNTSLSRLTANPLSRVLVGLVLFMLVAGGLGYFLSTTGESPDDAGLIGQLAKQPTETARETSSFGRFLAGRFAERQSDLEQAARLMAAVLEDQPDDERFLRQAFVLAVSAGHVEKATELARKMAGTKLNNSSARIVLIAADFRKKDYAAALTRLEGANTGGLGRYALPMAKAWSLVGQKKFVEAKNAIAALGEEKGFNVMYRLHAGLINALAGDAKEALKQFKQVNKSGKLTTAPVRVQRAVLPVLQTLGKKKEALAIINKQLSSNSNSLLFVSLRDKIESDEPVAALAATPSQGLSEGLFNLATALPRDRAGNVVLLYAQLARILQPKFPLAEILIGDILMSRERFADAAAMYRRVDPKSKYGWTSRLRTADALYEAERLDDARKLLEEMGDERPERLDALLRLGNFLRFKERYKDAVVIYDRAFKRLEKPKKRDWNLFYARGIALERAKKWDRAEKDFLKALELMPEQPYVLNYLGYSWVERRKNLAKAKKMIESAVAQRRNDGYIVDSMGWVLYRLGEFDKAVPHLERAVQLRPHDPIINDHLGDAYWRVGRKHEARFQWRRALSFKPEKQEQTKIEIKLEKGLGKPEILGKDG